MNFIEAIKLFYYEDKVRRTVWDKEGYIYLNDGLDNGLVLDEKEAVYDFDFNDYLANDWEIYKKEKNE